MAVCWLYWKSYKSKKKLWKRTGLQNYLVKLQLIAKYHYYHSHKKKYSGHLHAAIVYVIARTFL